jgi:hypothetical protein
VKPIAIVEILGPAAQGMSRPYRCRGENEAIYYVKGRQTDRRSLWSEWLCGHLAQAFGLNIPPFSLVELSEELLEETQIAWRDIGTGIAFGSQQHPSSSWFEPSFLNQVSTHVKQDVLVFDWWISNGDRMISNPNLLWDAVINQLIIIDHNQALDQNLNSADFHNLHIFREQLPSVFEDLAMRAKYAEKMSDALNVWVQACDNAPSEWHYANPEMDVPANIDLAACKALLTRCMTTDFWRMV